MKIFSPSPDLNVKQNRKRKEKRSLRQKGFTLIEVVAVTAMLGILSGLLLPSIDGANAKAKNAKLKSDLVTIDNALQLYRMENGTFPAKLEDLTPDYIAKNKDFVDALQNPLTYSGSETTYTLKGQNVSGEDVKSDGSADNDNDSDASANA